MVVGRWGMIGCWRAGFLQKSGLMADYVLCLLGGGWLAPIPSNYGMRQAEQSCVVTLWPKTIANTVRLARDGSWQVGG